MIDLNLEERQITIQIVSLTWVRRTMRITDWFIKSILSPVEPT